MGLPKRIYHGTAASLLPAIQAQGLRPRSGRLNKWDALPSCPDCVYLSDCYAPYYAFVAASHDLSAGRQMPDGWDDFQHKGLAHLAAGMRLCEGVETDTRRMPCAAIVEIDTACLDERLLRPDEDFLAMRNMRYDEGRDYDYRTQPYQEAVRHYSQRLGNYRSAWRASFNVARTVAYCGPIPATAITRVAVVDPKEPEFLRLVQLLGIFLKRGGEAKGWASDTVALMDAIGEAL